MAGRVLKAVSFDGDQTAVFNNLDGAINWTRRLKVRGDVKQPSVTEELWIDERNASQTAHVSDRTGRDVSAYISGGSNESQSNINHRTRQIFGNVPSWRSYSADIFESSFFKDGNALSQDSL